MKRTFLAIGLLAAASFNAQASDLSYTYVEANYTNVSFDSYDFEGFDVNPDLDGFGLRGSLKFTDYLYGFGSYSTGDGNLLEYSDAYLDADADFELERSNIGLGFRMAITENTDFLAELSYLRYDTTVDVRFTDSEGEFTESGSDSADGARFSLGLRGSMSEKFEGLAKLNYDDGGDLTGELSGTVGVQYKFSPTWGITGDVEIGEDANIYSIGVRATF